MLKYQSSFLSTEGLTSTSANHIANLAKEYIQNLEEKLNNIVLYTTTFRLISDTNITTLEEGDTKEFIEEIPSIVYKITQAKSLIAWLREGIKEKDNFLKGITNMHFEDYLLLKDETLEVPIMGNILTETEYYNSLSIKERNKYYELETLCAVIGKYIHPSGAYSKARKELSNKTKKPVVITGVGRDTIVYNYTPTIDSETVEKSFFELQDTHRKAQAELNAIKHKCQLAIEKSSMEVSNEYKVKYNHYKDKKDKLLLSYRDYLEEERQKISSLKIVIPNSLQDIYNNVNSLGK